MTLRPVWIDERKAGLHGLLFEWSAAPADATEVVHETIWRNRDWPPDQIASAVLFALGRPDRESGDAA